MKKEDLKKYIIIFIAAMFIISMFYNFGTSNRYTATAASNITAGTATSTCKISAYGSELIVQPWNNQTMEIAKRLKEQGYIEYINTDGKNGFLILSSKSNISYIRNAYIETDVNVFSQASCVINGIVNFTFPNGTKSQQAPGIVRMYLDPFNQIGDEIDIDLTADISATGIEYLISNPIAKTRYGTIDVDAKCYEYYLVVGGINWENRNIDLTEISSLLNISEQNINYTKNDMISFSKALNEEELKKIKEEINSSGIKYISKITNQAMIVNTTEKEEISELLARYGIETLFKPSQIIIYINSTEKLDKASEYLQKKGTLLSKQKACAMKTDAFATSDGMKIYIPSNMRKLENYIPIEKINEEQKLNLIVEFETIGRVAQNIVFINIQ